MIFENEINTIKNQFLIIKNKLFQYDNLNDKNNKIIKNLTLENNNLKTELNKLKTEFNSELNKAKSDLNKIQQNIIKISSELREIKKNV